MNRFLFLSLVVFSSVLNAQNNAFNGGEKLVYTASYNMSGIMNDLAQLTMETREVKTKSSTLIHLKCRATSFKRWDNFFKIRDLYESYVNPKTVTPYLYKREIEEGDYYKFVKYSYNHKSKTVNTFLRNKSTNFESGFWDRKEKIFIGVKTKDIIATLYYIRTLDIHKAQVGMTDSFPILFDNQKYNLAVTMLAKETIRTAIGEKECYKIGIEITNKAVFKGKTNNVIWLTADSNKIPVYGKFKVPVGSGELKIKSAIGLKN